MVRMMVVVLALAAGCAHDSYAAAEAKKAAALKAWEGKDISLFIQRMGSPDRVFEMPNGNVMYTWFTSGPDVRSSGFYYGGVATSTTTRTHCKIDFTAVPGGAIDRILINGNSCRIPNAPRAEVAAGQQDPSATTQAPVARP